MTDASAISATRPPSSHAAQRRRVRWQAAFFILFVMAPVFDVFRFDLSHGHAVVLGHDWRLGIDDFLAGRIGAGEIAGNILVRLFLPIALAAGALVAVAWRWGRLYCGWLCPHFSVVETINGLMRRAIGRPSVWERKTGPARDPDGTALAVDRRWWWVTVPLAMLFAFLWAVVLLTYLLPPFEIYGNLATLSPTRAQALFVGVGTAVLTCEFLFARHLFCRYACAVGLFQSLAWMSNRKALVVGFERARAADCTACYAAGGPRHSACESVCPMRLKPRMTKNAMFACTQCGQCVAACTTVQAPRASLLRWTRGASARHDEAPVSLTGRRDD